MGLVVLLAVTISAQATYESTVAELQSAEHRTRLRAVRALKESAFPDAALPVAALLADPYDDVQYEAIWTELNISLVAKVGPAERSGILVRSRDVIEAEPIFTAGPAALVGDAPPPPVLAALLRATTDDNPRVGVEALYAFGALAGPLAGAARMDLRRTARPTLVALLGSTDPVLRSGAVRVIGRAYGRLGTEPPVDPLVGDALVAVLNDREPVIVRQAMEALGQMRYDRAVQALTDLVSYYGGRESGTAALGGLAAIAHPSSAPILLAALGSRDDLRKRIAIEGLARLGDPAAHAAIAAALARERAAALQLAGHFAAALLAGADLDPLVNALAGTRSRAQAHAYLVEIAAVTPARLAPATRHADPSVREAVADILGESRNPDALQTLAPLTGDADPDVVAAAVRGSRRLRVDA